MKKNGSIGGTGKMRPPHVKRLGAAGVGVGLLALPVYGMANLLFETAILRDNSHWKKERRKKVLALTPSPMRWI